MPLQNPHSSTILNRLQIHKSITLTTDVNHSYVGSTAAILTWSMKKIVVEMNDKLLVITFSTLPRELIFSHIYSVLTQTYLTNISSSSPLSRAPLALEEISFFSQNQNISNLRLTCSGFVGFSFVVVLGVFVLFLSWEIVFLIFGRPWVDKNNPQAPLL